MRNDSEKIAIEPCMKKSAQRKNTVRKGSTHWAFMLMPSDPYYLPSEE